MLSVTLMFYAAVLQVSEPLPTLPTPAIATRLRSVEQRLRLHQIPECLKEAQEVVKAATTQKDLVGQAMAHELLAAATLENPLPDSRDVRENILLFESQQSPMERAIEQWRAAAANWEKLGVVPKTIHAKAVAAFIEWSLPIQQLGSGDKESAEDAERLLAEALHQGQAVTQRKRQTARMLNEIGASLYYMGKNDLATRYLQAARALLGKGDDLDTAAVDHNLGMIASAQRRYAEAKQRYLHVQAVMQRLQPASLAMALTLRWLTRDALAQGKQEEAAAYSDQFERQIYERTTFPEMFPVAEMALLVCRSLDGRERLRAIAGPIFSPVTWRFNSMKLDQDLRTPLALAMGKGEKPTASMLTCSAYEAMADADSLLQDAACFDMAQLAVLTAITKIVPALDPSVVDSYHKLPTNEDVADVRAAMAHPGVCANTDTVRQADKAEIEFAKRADAMERDTKFAQRWQQVRFYYRTKILGFSGPRSERLMKTGLYHYVNELSEADMTMIVSTMGHSPIAPLPGASSFPAFEQIAQVSSAEINVRLDLTAKAIDPLLTAHRPALAWQRLEAEHALSLRSYLAVQAQMQDTAHPEQAAELRRLFKRAWMLQELVNLAQVGQYGSYVELMDLRLAGATQARIEETERNKAYDDKMYAQMYPECLKCFQEMERINSLLPIPKGSVPPAITAAQVPALLPHDTTYISFLTAADHTCVFLFAPDHLEPEVFTLPIHRDTLTVRIQEVRDWVAQPGLKEEQSIKICRSLYGSLFPGRLRAAIGQAKRLLLSPDGPLWDLPFAALVTNASGSPVYLGEQKPLTYIESLDVLRAARRKRTARTQSPTACVFANPTFSDRVAPMVELLQLHMPTGSLANTVPQAQQIADLYQGSLITGEQASEERVIEALHEAAVVHLMTHGLTPILEQFSMFSGVCLALPKTSSEKGDNIRIDLGNSKVLSLYHDNDGFLQPWEVLAQGSLDTELVVLAACESSKGSTVAESGQFGFTRGFLYAGAHSLIGTLWRVWDTSTGTMMIEFHRGMKAGLPKDEALRRAIVMMRRNSATGHPFHWAAFALSGDPDNPLFAKR